MTNSVEMYMDPEVNLDCGVYLISLTNIFAPHSIFQEVGVTGPPWAVGVIVR